MTDNRNAYLRVGATAAAVFVALLLAGVARGEGPVDPGVPANATPTPESHDPGYRDGPSRRDPRGGGAPMPDFGGVPMPDFGGAPGDESVPAPGGGSVPDLGGGESVPAPGGDVPMPDFGGGDAAPDPGGTEPAPDTTEGATT